MFIYIYLSDWIENNINQWVYIKYKLQFEFEEPPRMSCFIGISVEQELDPQAFELAMSEIQDYASQTNYKIISHPHLFIIVNRYQKFCLPKNCDYIHSNLQHFVISQQDDEEYIQTIVQCLMILKEHLPHKIHIQMISELEQIFNLKNKVDQEVPRRLINHLKIIQQKSKKSGLTNQQVHMLIHNLSAQFHKDYMPKLRSLSLKILSQGKVDGKIWNELSKQQIKIIDEIVNDPMHQKVAIQILERIVRHNEYKVISFSDQKQNNDYNSFENDQIHQEPIPDYNGPLDPMTALFQLRESLNITRISWIIQNIDCERLEQKKLVKFDNRIQQVAQKFLNGLFDSSPISHSKLFGKCLSEYQMRRGKTKWNGLVQQVLIKIEDMEKIKGKRKTSPKSSVNFLKS